ncbi:MAG: type II and III secretion system protein family protein [Rhodobacteraceae bacterium]|nr:type II and III secretion system protein family protein [Paracoccaceae bacterium]
MQYANLIKVGLLGFAISAPMVSSAIAQSAVLTVMRGSVSSQIGVSVNRAIVVESDRPFAELSVANPAIANVSALSDRTIYVLGVTSGATTLTLFDQDGRLIANVDVRVTPDIAEFKDRLREILPNEPIEVRTANDGIVLSGRVSGARKVSRAMELANRYAPGRVTNLMVVGGSQQVMLQVRFAEMQRSVAKSLGSSVSLSSFVAPNSGVVLGTGGTGVEILDGGGVPFMASSPESLGAVGVGFGIGGIAVNVLIEALESKGMVRTLAEPNIVAISGQRAEFLAGGEYPVPVTDSDGNISIEYRPFGVQLNFTPVVIDDEVIRLELETIVSSIDPSAQSAANGTPLVTFKVRRASTTIEMRDGQSFAIAGLLQDDFSDASGQVPWLGDVPILGALFRSAEFQREQTELVIIITPHLVTPTSGNALAMPTDRMRIPTEAELFLNGQLEGSNAFGDVSLQAFDGAAGYVME